MNKTPVYVELELINGADLALMRGGIIGEYDVKHRRVNALVATECVPLCINKNIQEQLQLPVVGTKKAQMANGVIVECEVVAPVELRFKNRRTICQAIVLPGNSQILLGVIALEDLDVLIDLQQNKLIVHPDRPYFAQTKI